MTKLAINRLVRHWLAVCLFAITQPVNAGLLDFNSIKQSEESGDTGSYAVADALGAQPGNNGFARAIGPHVFTFPRDHGAHPEFRNEWWYFTGNLATNTGRRFGYQLTFFRIALQAEPSHSKSAWRTSQIYMAHFALSDADGKQFYAGERFARGALGLAGATASPLRVWLEHWQAVSLSRDGFPLTLSASLGEVQLTLDLNNPKPFALQGNNGLSQKSAELGNASYYYSATRLPSRGTIQIGEQRFAVTGLSWFDREWSTSALGPNQVGWDWFAIQLDDGREIMYYQLRTADGTTDTHSAGSLIARNGAVTQLSSQQVELTVTDHWSSPTTNTRYPSQWRLQVPSEGLDLEVTPLLADQELNLTVRYWEGAVTTNGRSNGQPITGHGYVELAGY